MKDRFGCELNPGDLLLHTQGKCYAKDMIYGVYTEYDTMLMYNRLQLQYSGADIENLREEKLWTETTKITDFKLKAYKVHNMCAEEKHIYDIVLPIYQKRMAGVEYYEKHKTGLAVGDVIANRLDLACYMYCGRLRGIKVFKSYDNERPVDIAITDKVPRVLTVLYNSTGMNLYYNFSFTRSSMHITAQDLINAEDVGATLFSFANDNSLSSAYYLNRLKSYKGNMYYCGHCNLGKYYNKDSNILLMTFRVGKMCYYVRLELYER